MNDMSDDDLLAAAASSDAAVRNAAILYKQLLDETEKIKRRMDELAQKTKGLQNFFNFYSEALHLATGHNGEAKIELSPEPEQPCRAPKPAKSVRNSPSDRDFLLRVQAALQSHNKPLKAKELYEAFGGEANGFEAFRLRIYKLRRAGVLPYDDNSSTYYLAPPGEPDNDTGDES